MVGAPLNDDVSRAHCGFALVHYEHQLTFEHDPVVHGFGSMHERMRRVRSGVSRRVGRTYCGEVFARCISVEVTQLVSLWRNVEDADPRPLLRWCENQALFGRFTARTINSRRRLTRIP